MTEDTSATRRDMMTGAAVALAGVGLVAAAAGKASRAEAAAADDIPTLNALITAENQAVEAYTAGAGILDTQANDMMDPLRTLAGTVKAVAVHFQQQHKDHAAALGQLVRDAGGTPSTAGGWMAPAGLKPSVLNIIKLAANAEKAAAIAYTNAQKGLTAATSAKVVAAIGANETQHFVVLYSLAEGLVVPGTMPDPLDIVPRGFVVDVGTQKGLGDVADLPVNT